MPQHCLVIHPDPGLLSEHSPIDSRFSVWQGWERGLIVGWLKEFNSWKDLSHTIEMKSW